METDSEQGFEMFSGLERDGEGNEECDQKRSWQGILKLGR